MWHEISHFVVGKGILNGICTLSVYIGGGGVECRFVELTYNQYILYALAGIIGESMFALILLLIPYTSSLGGYWILNVGINHFLGAYKVDLQDTHLSFLLEPTWRIFFLIEGIAVFALSLYIFYSSWKNLRS
ncbi:MAG: hypothetical protein ACE5KD_04190 [Candidatus Bathyarchaeia archaeon]